MLIVNAENTLGTASAGVIAVARGNGYCGSGVAPMASKASDHIYGDGYYAHVAARAQAMYDDEVSTDGRRVRVSSNL